MKRQFDAYTLLLFGALFFAGVLLLVRTCHAQAQSTPECGRGTDSIKYIIDQSSIVTWSLPGGVAWSVDTALYDIRDGSDPHPLSDSAIMQQPYWEIGNWGCGGCHLFDDTTCDGLAVRESLPVMADSILFVKWNDGRADWNGYLVFALDTSLLVYYLDANRFNETTLYICPRWRVETYSPVIELFRKRVMWRWE